MKGTEYKTRIEQFITEGFVKIENAFSTQIAKQCRDILWKDTGCDPDDPSTWTKPVVWLGNYTQEPFLKAANTKVLHHAYDQLAGAHNWIAPKSVGSFPIRFPNLTDTGDTGWHIDVSFANELSDPSDYFTWRANIKSQGRALLMLFLFSDTGSKDAPTKIRVSSHLDIAKRLSPAGNAGLSAKELAANNYEESAGRTEIPATGEAGTVYLCHPFLVHAATLNFGTQPRFMAQPPLFPAKQFQLNRVDSNYNPVEIAIRRGLGLIQA